MRNCTLLLSVILTLLAIALSTWNRPAARMSALPALPQVPLAGMEKAAGLIQLVIVCPGVGSRRQMDHPQFRDAVTLSN
jgi:hypothetical protein